MPWISTLASVFTAIISVSGFPADSLFSRSVFSSLRNHTLSSAQEGSPGNSSLLREDTFTVFPSGPDPPDDDHQQVFLFDILGESPHLQIKFNDWTRLRIRPPREATGAIAAAIQEAEAAPQPLEFMQDHEYSWMANRYSEIELWLQAEEPERYHEQAVVIGLTWKIWKNALINGLKGFNDAYPGYLVKFEIYATPFGDDYEAMVASGALRSYVDGVEREPSEIVNSTVAVA